ncbi:MAG: aminoglycoside phosphotransferase family protein [Candidatus Pacebacteria bacterium]|nr:aminoglycoside phosphotransferase family protein [Candidatus Paceibacterota bacterium]
MKEIIVRITESALGHGYTNLESIVGRGKNNQVFKVEIEGVLYILRLHNSVQQLVLYEKEKWCAEIARKSGVKTPEITHVGLVDDWSYSIQEYIEGTCGTEAAKEEVWFKLGQVAKILHQIPASEISLNYNQKIEDLFRDDFFVEKNIFSPELSQAIIERLTGVTSREFTPFLCHGNLHPSNVILDNEGQLWLFDWETASGNLAPQADLAEIYTWNNGKDSIEKFREGYGLSKADLQIMMRDIQTLVLLRLIDVMRRMVVRNGGFVDLKNRYIKETIQRLRDVKDFQATILFTKNL